MGCIYSYRRVGNESLLPNSSGLIADRLDVTSFKAIAQNAGADRYLGPDDRYSAQCYMSTENKTVRSQYGNYTKKQTEIYWPDIAFQHDPRCSLGYEAIDPSVDVVAVDTRALTKVFPDYEDLDEWNGLEASLQRCRVKFCATKTGNATIQNGELKVEERSLALRLLGDNHINVTYGTNDTTQDETDEVLFRMSSVERGYLGKFVEQNMDRLINMEATADSLANMRTDEIANMLSTALSAFMLSSQNMKRSTIPGAAFTTETYVKVRWGWATLPGFIVLSAVIFLVLTMWDSGRSNQLFKASVLAGYFHGVEGLTQLSTVDHRIYVAKKDERHDYHSMLERSKKIKVRLTRREDGALVFAGENSKDGP